MHCQSIMDLVSHFQFFRFTGEASGSGSGSEKGDSSSLAWLWQRETNWPWPCLVPVAILATLSHWHGFVTCELNKLENFVRWIPDNLWSFPVWTTPESISVHWFTLQTLYCQRNTVSLGTADVFPGLRFSSSKKYRRYFWEGEKWQPEIRLMSAG